MKANLLSCVDGRSGERLVQGVLLFLLRSNLEFRTEFCRWLEWPVGCDAVREEVADGIHRHDLVFDFADGTCRTVELKLLAEFTHAQATDSECIHIVIVPAYRREETTRALPKVQVKTWEDVLEIARRCGPAVSSLLDGLNEYGWLGLTTSKARIVAEIQEWWDKDADIEYHGADFLRKCGSRATLKPLTTTSSYKAHKKDCCGYWGRYIKNPAFDDWRDWLWFGFVFNVDTTGKVNDCVLLLQCMSTRIARLVDFKTPFPDWYSKKGTGESMCVIVLDSEGNYTVDDWWKVCHSYVEAYAKLKR